MNYSPPGSSVHGVLQARVLEWVAISFSRGSSWPRDWTWVSCIAGRFFTIWATRKMCIKYITVTRSNTNMSYFYYMYKEILSNHTANSQRTEIPTNTFYTQSTKHTARYFLIFNKHTLIKKEYLLADKCIFPTLHEGNSISLKFLVLSFTFLRGPQERWSDLLDW